MSFLIPLSVLLLVATGVLVTRLGDIVKVFGFMLYALAALIGVAPFVTATFGGQPKVQDFVLLMVSVVLVIIAATNLQKWVGGIASPQSQS